MNLPKGKKIILFDGDCGLCNQFVRFIINRDKKDVFRFAPLNSAVGLELQKQIGIQDLQTDSVVLYIPEQAYFIRSSAALEIARDLSGLGRIDMLLRLFPEFFRDGIYNLIARNRRKWFGEQSCDLDFPREKFLNYF